MKYILILGILLMFSACQNQTPKDITIENISFLEVQENSMSPNLVAQEGKLGLTWLQTKEGEASLMYSEFTKGVWNSPSQIAKGNDWFVNWADFPAHATNGDLLLTSYLEKSADGTFTYDVRLNLQHANGSSIRENFLLNTDGIKAEHGFVSMIPNESDGFFISWLDGRNTAGGSHDEGHGGHSGAMTLRTAEITAEGEITNELELDYKTCDCCQTSMTNTNEGPLVVYRDRSEREIRDIYFIQRIGEEWTEPKPIFQDGWKINGCPVNGPKVISNENTIACAWFTAANDTPQVKVAFSKNERINFSNPIVLNDLTAVGRVDVAFMNDSEVLVSYMESDASETFLKVKKVSSFGDVSEAYTIAKLSASRGTGVPQLELLENEAYVVWTEILNEMKHLKGVKFNVEQL